MLGAMARFALVGGGATGLHLAVAMAAMALGVAPLAANALAFATAFAASFGGHHRFSFAGHGVAARAALGRFVIVALIGFAVNQTALALMLGAGVRRAGAAVVAATALAAASSFVLARFWAFRAARAQPPSDAAQRGGHARAQHEEVIGRAMALTHAEARCGLDGAGDIGLGGACGGGQIVAARHLGGQRR